MSPTVPSSSPLLRAPSDEGPASATVGADPADTLPFPPPAILPPSLEAADLPLPPGFLHQGVLSHTAMGIVYKAHDLALGRSMAVKVTPLTDAAAAAQHARELRQAASITHRAIVRIDRVIENAETVVCIMELCPGPDAATLIARYAAENLATLAADRLFRIADRDPQSIRPDLRAAAVPPSPYFHLVAAWMADVADAVQAAHNAGLTHRDIKPANLLMDGDGTLKLADFGSAAAIDVRSAAVRTASPLYIAPERLAELSTPGTSRLSDRRVDVWGLGLTLYEFLALHPAFEARTVADALRAVATTDPTPPSAANWGVPRELEDVCVRCLKRNPDERPADAAAVAAHLRQYLAAPSGLTVGQRVAQTIAALRKGGRR